MLTRVLVQLVINIIDVAEFGANAEDEGCIGVRRWVVFGWFSKENDVLNVERQRSCHTRDSDGIVVVGVCADW